MAVPEWSVAWRPRHTERHGFGVIRTNLPAMFTMLIHINRSLRRFEQWFDTRFGWFFTNGMKEVPGPDEGKAAA